MSEEEYRRLRAKAVELYEAREAILVRLLRPWRARASCGGGCPLCPCPTVEEALRAEGFSRVLAHAWAARPEDLGVGQGRRETQGRGGSAP